MRYSKYRRDEKSEVKQTNPIWRGIGCLLLIIVPIVSFAISNLLFTSRIIQQYIALPPALARSLTLPGTEATVPFFYGSLALSLAISIAILAIFFIVYSFLYRILGPSPYGPTDVPPVRARSRVRRSR